MTEVDALIVRNIGDLEGAVARLEGELEKQIGQEINSTVENWAEKVKWRGIFDWYGDKDDIWVASPDWRGENEEDEDDFDFWFSFAATNGTSSNPSEGDRFWLTSLCRAGRAEYGFVSNQDKFKYPKGRRWKAKIEPFVQDFVRGGLSYDDKQGQIFIPVSIDQEQLARAIENEDLGSALAPIAVALDRVIEAKPIIDQLRIAAKTLP